MDAWHAYSTCSLSRRSGSLTTAAPQSSTIHSNSSGKNTEHIEMLSVLKSTPSERFSVITSKCYFSTFISLTLRANRTDSFQAATFFDQRDRKKVNTQFFTASQSVIAVKTTLGKCVYTPTYLSSNIFIRQPHVFINQRALNQHATYAVHKLIM